MKLIILTLVALVGASSTAVAQLGASGALAAVSIGIDVPSFPRLVPVPGHPVYYAPQLEANYFFHEGRYWLYRRDNWYAATWYNGPWGLVTPEAVPHSVLRIPVRYFRQAPAYFGRWSPNAAPHWGEYWGASWERNYGGYDSRTPTTSMAPGPLPLYQRQYTGSQYPRPDQQLTFQARNFGYEPTRVQPPRSAAAGGVRPAPERHFEEE